MFARIDMEPLMDFSTAFDLESSFGQCPKKCRKMTESCTMDKSNWCYKLSLASYPTKPEDLHINLKDSTLTLSGKSEVTEEKDFKVFSTHIWSKEIEVPKRMKKESLKAKLDKNTLMLCADLDDESTEIKVTVADEEMPELNENDKQSKN